MWLALAAVLTLLMSPLLAGHARAETATPMPMAAAHAAPCRTCPDPVCAAACALSAQLVVARVAAGEPPRRQATVVDYATLDRHPAGTAPQQGTPPPR